MAAFKSVGESVKNPIAYYQNNLGSLLSLLAEVEKTTSPIYFIFTILGNVYGEVKKLPISENVPIHQVIALWEHQADRRRNFIRRRSCDRSISVISLRYFNPIGAHSSVAIGDHYSGRPQNLVPFITQTAAYISCSPFLVTITLPLTALLFAITFM